MEHFNTYQEFTKSMAVYNEDIALFTGELTEFGAERAVTMPYIYPAFALAEEAGEVVGKIAKFVRKSRQEVNIEKLRSDVGKELGDALFQLSETARQFGYTLQEIAEMNVEKLTDRKDRGVLVGEGDNR